MTGGTEQVATAAHRRQEIGRLYLEGWTQPAIADKFGVNQSTISRDLAAIRKEWMKSAVLDFNEAKAREIAKIDRLEMEYWQAWQESKEATRKTAVKGKGSGKKPDYLEKTETIEERHGNSQYLAGVQWCIEQRLKIYGAYAPTRQDVNSTGRIEVFYTNDWRGMVG